MKESDIRPKELVERYIKLSEKDAAKLFLNAEFQLISCVACGHESPRLEFQKNDFKYSRCSECSSLFMNPRPDLNSFEMLYSNSESARYWAEVFFPSVAERRREAIFAPRVTELKTKLGDKLPKAFTAIDVGAGYGIFLEELQKEFPNVSAIAIEPSAELSDTCKKKGIRTEICMAEDAASLRGLGDLVSCFEVLEHVHSPTAFLQSIYDLMKPGGYLYLTTLTSDGLDLFSLGADSFQVSPPHHINFLSLKGMEELVKTVGLEVVDISTPGLLDLEIIIKSAAFKAYDGMFKEFFSRLEKNSDLATAFQDFLRKNKLSSHMRIIAQRRAS